MNRLGRVAVLMGGPSAEREISLISGRAVLEALRSRNVDAHAFDPAERELFELKREAFHRVFIALHGRFGEDGTVQGALEVMRIPYTGSGVMGSALAMDKWRTKLVWDASGIPTPRFAMVKSTTDWEKVSELLGLPVIVKPAREGSTIGLTKVSTPADFHAAWKSAGVCTFVSPMVEPSRAGFTITGMPRSSETFSQSVVERTIAKRGVGMPEASHTSLVRHLSMASAEPITPLPV